MRPSVEPNDGNQPRSSADDDVWVKYTANGVSVVFGLAMVLMNTADCNILVLNIRAILHWILGLSVGTLVALAPGVMRLFRRDFSVYPTVTARVVKVDDPMARLPAVARSNYLYRKIVWVVEQEDVNNVVSGEDHVTSDPHTDGAPAESTIVAVRGQDDFAVGDAITLVRHPVQPSVFVPTTTANQSSDNLVYVPFQRHMACFALRKLAWALLGVGLTTAALYFLYPGAPVAFASSAAVAAASERYFCQLGNDDNIDDDEDCCQISTVATWGYNVFCTFPIVLLVGFTVRRLWLARQRLATTTPRESAAQPLVPAESELI